MRSSLVLVGLLVAFTLVHCVANPVEAEEKTKKKKKKLLERQISIVAEPSEKGNGPVTEINNAVEVSPEIKLDVAGARDSNNPVTVVSMEAPQKLSNSITTPLGEEKPRAISELSSDDEEVETVEVLETDDDDEKLELLPGLDAMEDDEDSEERDVHPKQDSDFNFEVVEDNDEPEVRPELLPGLIEKDEDKVELVADDSALTPGLNEEPEFEKVPLEPNQVIDFTSYARDGPTASNHVVLPQPIYVSPATMTQATPMLVPVLAASNASDLGQLLWRDQFAMNNNNLLQMQAITQLLLQQHQQLNWFQMVMLQQPQGVSRVATTPQVMVQAAQLAMMGYQNLMVNPMVATAANILYPPMPMSVQHESVQLNSNRQLKEIVENYPRFGANLFRTSSWSPFAPPKHWAESMSDPSGFNTKLPDGSIKQILPLDSLPYPSAVKYVVPIEHELPIKIAKINNVNQPAQLST